MILYEKGLKKKTNFLAILVINNEFNNLIGFFKYLIVRYL